MTRRRHFPSVLMTMGGIDEEHWNMGIRLVKRLHGDALLMPAPWASLDTMEAVLAAPPINPKPLEPHVKQARNQRIGVFLEICLPHPQSTHHDVASLRAFQQHHLQPLMSLELAGILIRRGNAWPPNSILNLERLVRLKEGTVLFLDHGRAPDTQLMDGQVDGIVDPSGVAGITRFLKGACSGFALGHHLEQQQHRLGINLAGRLLNPMHMLDVDDDDLDMGINLCFALRGYPMLPPPPHQVPEYLYGTAAQLRQDREVLEWGRFINLSPSDAPETFAFARADERLTKPVLVIARRRAGPAISLPVRAGIFDAKQPFVNLHKDSQHFQLEGGWLDLPAVASPQLLMLGQ